ncbi:MAG: PTS sugar transporter subunit IIA [Planctomycetota bacterium]|nr:PTS sugar transporter subunit IIA [Planctomycetota bacterium]
MKLSEIICDEAILDDLQNTEKRGAIEEIVDALVKAGKIEKQARQKVVKALMDREDLGSTGIGMGVAVPHAKHDSVSGLVGAFARSKKGVAFDALDGEPVYVIFLLLSSKSASGSHLEALAYISRLLRDDNFVRFLKEAKDKEGIKELLREGDQNLGVQ